MMLEATSRPLVSSVPPSILARTITTSLDLYQVARALAEVPRGSRAWLEGYAKLTALAESKFEMALKLAVEGKTESALGVLADLEGIVPKGTCLAAKVAEYKQMVSPAS